MKMILPGRSSEPARNADEAQAAAAAAARVEGDLGELIRRDVAPLRRPQRGDPNGDPAVSQVNSWIERVSGGSVNEIERLIMELTNLRDFLLDEGQRVQREITGYAHMSQSAISSTKIMVEGVSKWKAAMYLRKPVTGGQQQGLDRVSDRGAVNQS
jgi:hypothetical protein